MTDGIVVCESECVGREGENKDRGGVSSEKAEREGKGEKEVREGVQEGGERREREVKQGDGRQERE